MITYDNFWNILKERGENWYTLTTYHHISNSLLNRIKHNHSISIATLDRLCQLLHCEPGDILTYQRDSEEE